MAQESTLTSNKTVAIVGAGPAGCACAKFLQEECETTLFDKGSFLRTILPTGGGRCNLAHNECDYMNLAKNYPRGEKFLYSILSRFGTYDSIDFFNNIGIKTYVQQDNRIFPVSNSSKEVKEKLLKSLKCKTIKEEVLKIEKISNCFKIKTNKSTYAFDYVVIAIGGHSNFKLISDLGINIIEPAQSLVGLITSEDFSSIAGVSLKNVLFKDKNYCWNDDIIFTHKGISGPLIYKISSIYARKILPFKISLRLIDEIDLQTELNNNSKKEIKNLLGNFIPKSLAVYILKTLNINENLPCHKIDSEKRNAIIDQLYNFTINVTGKVADSEVVTCGGVDLKEINPKTLEAKKQKGLFFCGEVLDIDGFCGGFNLQNCWSTGYVVSESIKKELNY